MNPEKALLLLSLALQAFACSADDDNCAVQATSLSSPEAVSPLGFTLSDVTGGRSSWTAPLHWASFMHNDDGNVRAEFHPSNSDTTATFEILTVERLEAVQVARHDPSRVAGMDICRSHLKASVLSRISTADGALDERTPGGLKAFAPEEAVLSAQLDPNGLSGSFRISEVNAPAPLNSGKVVVDLFVDLRAGAISGSLLGQVGPVNEERASGGSTSASFGFLIATWGSSER